MSQPVVYMEAVYVVAVEEQYKPPVKEYTPLAPPKTKSKKSYSYDYGTIELSKGLACFICCIIIIFIIAIIISILIAFSVI